MITHDLSSALATEHIRDLQRAGAHARLAAAARCRRTSQLRVTWLRLRVAMLRGRFRPSVRTACCA